MNKTLLKDVDSYSWRHTTVSQCGTHHVQKDGPCYDKRFQNVLKFHEPGYAPVKDNTGSYHIDTAGNPIYHFRFVRTFGFYEGFAAVSSPAGWFHILPNGDSLYEERYDWCGNFQEGLCPVRDKAGYYFHINGLGQRIYDQNYAYVGDFKDGIAVVCREDGKSSHIDWQGNFIHSRWYSQLDVFHKDFAKAKDDRGWVHIRKDGTPTYSKRFLSIEPFYNGQAHVEDVEGNLLVIDEEGQTIKKISKSQTSLIGDLSGNLVGFWTSETIKLAVELNVLDNLPASLDELKERVAISPQNLERFLRALWEIGIVNKEERYWSLTKKGQLLSPKDQSFMASASLMWPQVQKEWLGLKEKLLDNEIYHHPTFKEEASDERSLGIYRHALMGYAQEDFFDISTWVVWDEYSTLLGFGQTAITLLTDILKIHPLLKGITLNEDRPLYHLKLDESIKPRLQQIFTSLNRPLNVKADAVLLPRFLHYFPDEEASQILLKIRNILPPEGKIYVFEMILDSLQPSGSLLDLNMLAESGGKLRTLPQWKELLSNTGFHLDDCQTLKTHLQLIIGKKS